MNTETISKLIRDIPDFPTPGIIFKDITPVWKDPEAFSFVTDQLAEFAQTVNPTAVVAIEARGFVFGAVLAHKLELSLVPVRKVGKLPWNCIKEEYALEYGTATVEMHNDAIEPGQRVLIVDDLLATGGTAKAAAKLVERLGGKVAGIAFVVELDFLKGRDQLPGYDVFSMVHY